ncbi:filamin-C isoform X1 [Tachysurus ichikawai]
MWDTTALWQVPSSEWGHFCDNSKAIVDGNLKLILGLIWTLILHYSISMPMWEDEEDEDAKKLTPKQRLLGWIQNKVPQLPINNFHRDWRDGKALGALVDNCAPGESMVPACGYEIVYGCLSDNLYCGNDYQGINGFTVTVINDCWVSFGIPISLFALNRPTFICWKPLTVFLLFFVYDMM